MVKSVKPVKPVKSVKPLKPVKSDMNNKTWAMGLEHEMHIFHMPYVIKGNEKLDGFVLYNSHEVLTDILINHSDEMTEDDKKYAKELWTIFETSGRFCGGHWVVKGTQTKMPEFVTG